MSATFVDLGLDRIHQRDDALDFMDQNQGWGRKGGEFSAQARRLFGIGQVGGLIRQVNNAIGGEGMGQSGLADRLGTH